MNLTMIVSSILLSQDRDDRISLEDFLEGSKRDPDLIQTLCLYEGTLWQGTNIRSTQK